MNRPRTVPRPRPFPSPRRTPRTRPEAAAELVRVEYERDRLERDLRMLDGRRNGALTSLERLDTRARMLSRMLANPGVRADRSPS